MAYYSGAALQTVPPLFQRTTASPHAAYPKGDLMRKPLTQAQMEVLFAPGREYYCRLYAGYEPHPVVVFDDKNYVRCDR